MFAQLNKVSLFFRQRKYYFYLSTRTLARYCIENKNKGGDPAARSRTATLFIEQRDDFLER